MIAEKFRHAVEQASFSGGEAVLRFTVSIGVAQALHTNGQLDGTIARADAALYRAKASGRNKVVVAQPPVDQAA